MILQKGALKIITITKSHVSFWMVIFKLFRIQFSKVFNDSNYIILGLLDSLHSGLSLSKLPIENKPRVGRNYVIALHIEQKSKEHTALLKLLAQTLKWMLMKLEVKR